MINRLHTHSVNKSTNKTRTTSTPESDGLTMLSEIDVCYSIEYYNYKVKTFWGRSKAYTYPIKESEYYMWTELTEYMRTMSDNQIKV